MPQNISILPPSIRDISEASTDCIGNDLTKGNEENIDNYHSSAISSLCTS